MSNTHTAEAAALSEEEPFDRIVLFALDEATEKLEQGGELEPFTVILHGENLHVESHPGEDAVDCFNSATEAVQRLAHVLHAYVFVYDGYVNTSEGARDAIIVERARPGDETAEAFALIYSLDEAGEGSLEFEEGIYDLGSASSLLLSEPATSEDLDEL